MNPALKDQALPTTPSNLNAITPRRRNRLFHSVLVAALALSACALFFAPQTMRAAATGTKWSPGNWIRAAGNTQMAYIYGNPNFVGAQRAYDWKDIEPSQGVYDFSAIIADSAALAAQGKKLVIRIDTKNFGNSGISIIPDYVVAAGGEIVNAENNRMAAFWRPACYTALINLINALGKQFDDDPVVAGYIFQETALGPFLPGDAPTRDEYRKALKDRMRDTKAAFPKTPVFQNANYMPRGDEAEGIPIVINYIINEKLGGISCPDAQVDSTTVAYHKSHKGIIPLGSDNQKATADFATFYTSEGGRDVYDMWDLLTSEVSRPELGSGKSIGRWANYVFWEGTNADEAPGYPSAAKELEQSFRVSSQALPEHTIVTVVAERGFPDANQKLPTNLEVAPPNKPVAVASGTTITVNWQDNANNESGFEIERKTGTWMKI